MAAYKWVVLNEMVQRVVDHAFIPNDPANKDWQEFQLWLGMGNAPDPADPPPVLDESDYDNLPRAQRAAIRLLGNYLGKTQSQIETDYHNTYLTV